MTIRTPDYPAGIDQPAWLDSPIETDRLVVRQGIPSDAVAIATAVAAASSATSSTHINIPGTVNPLLLEDVKANIARNGGMIAITDRNGTVVGSLSVQELTTGTVEIGVVLLPEHQKKGFAREGLKAFIDRVFETTDITRVVARVPAGRRKPQGKEQFQRSEACVGAIGMVETSDLPHLMSPHITASGKIDYRPISTASYELTAERWAENRVTPPTL